MRKILVTVISIIYMIMGLLNFASSLLPTSYSSGYFIINIIPLIGGALAFYAGATMLRLNEFGRKFVVALLSTRVALNVWSLFYLKDGAWLGWYYRGEQIYRIENRYAYPIFLLIWMAIYLLIIIFLSQKETRKIFAPETIDNVNSSDDNSGSVESDILI